MKSRDHYHLTVVYRGAAHKKLTKKLNEIIRI